MPYKKYSDVNLDVELHDMGADRIAVTDSVFRTFRSKWAGRLHRVGDGLKRLARNASGWVTNHYNGHRVERDRNDDLLNEAGEVTKRTVKVGAGLVGTVVGLPGYVAGAGLEYVAAQIEDSSFRYLVNPNGDIAQTDKDFVMVSRNVAVLPPALRGNNRLRDTRCRVQELVNSFLNPLGDLPQADVICLQEVFLDKYNKQLCEGLSSTYPYILYNTAPKSLGMGSGLFMASKFPIKAARYVEPKLPLFMRKGKFPYFTISPEGVSRKGILFTIIERDGKNYMVINAHLKSNISDDEKENEQIEKIRFQSAQVLTQEMNDFADECAAEGIEIEGVLLGADLNISDRDNNGAYTFERTGKDPRTGQTKRPNHPRDYDFLFSEEGYFPGESEDTWLMAKSDIIQFMCDGQQKGMEHVRFDHTGYFPMQSARNGSKTNQGWHVRLYDDQNQSFGQDTPSSDHAGLQLIIENKALKP